MLPLNLNLSAGGGKSASGDSDSGTGQGSAGSAAGVNSTVNTSTTRIYGGTGNTGSSAAKQDATQSASPDVKSSAANPTGDGAILVYVAIGIGVLALIVSSLKK